MNRGHAFLSQLRCSAKMAINDPSDTRLGDNTLALVQPCGKSGEPPLKRYDIGSLSDRPIYGKT